jgi:ubiquinone/menaquinone biosynthesis C-methylase UbiE
VKKTDVVLDVGTGRGLMAIGFAKKAKKVYAIDRWRHRDLLANSIERSTQNAKFEGVGKKIVFKAGDPKKIPFKDKTFDIVVCTYAILNLPHGGRKKALGEMVRVLKPKGRILIADVMDFTKGSKRAFTHALKEFGVKDVSSSRFDISTILVGRR